MNGNDPNSGIAVLPTTTAPAARSRRTTSPSAATGVVLARPPNVVTQPATSSSSLIATGTPCSGPSASPRASAASRAVGLDAGPSASTTVNALKRGFSAAIRSSAASTTARADTSPLLVSRTVSTTPMHAPTLPHPIRLRFAVDFPAQRAQTNRCGIRPASRARRRWRSEKRPSPPATSSAGEPSSTIRPCSITSTRSAISTVESRWAMITAVRPASTVRSACCTSRSDGMSSDEVASSRISTAGSARNARAKATSWRWPALSSAASVGDLGLVALGQRADEAVGAERGGAASTTPRCGAGPAEADVVGDRAGEQVVLLGDHHHRRGAGLVGEVAQVDAVEQHPAADRVVEAGRQLGERGLAGPGGADQRQGLARRDVRSRSGSTGTPST